jgi:hypothetical protein
MRTTAEARLGKFAKELRAQYGEDISDEVIMLSPYAEDVSVADVLAVVADNVALRAQVYPLRAENEQLAADLGKLRAAFEALKPWVAPMLNDFLRNTVMPLWRAIEPILEAQGFEGSVDEVAGQPSHGDSGTCSVCGGVIEFYEETAGNGDVLNSWWSHVGHPRDEHDAQLGGPA